MPHGVMIPCASLLLRPLLIINSLQEKLYSCRRETWEKETFVHQRDLVHLALACKCPVPGALDPLHHRAFYLAKVFSILFKTYFVKICLILSKFVFFCQYLSFFVNICLFLSTFVKIGSLFVKICLYLSIFCQNLSLFVFICLHLSIFVLMCLDLPFFVFIHLYLSKFAWAA